MNVAMSSTQADALRRLPLFAGLSDESLQQLAEIATEVQVPAGQTLTRPNDAGRGMYVIEEGTVVVEMRKGREVKLGQGEFFGELALLVPDAIRVARVRAETEVRALAITRDGFHQLLDREPQIAVAMLPVIAGRLAKMVQEA
jgi:CRP-like cAMP-binding protein